MFNEDIKCSFTERPFRSTLSFELLIGHIRDISVDKSHPLYLTARDTLKKLESVPELLGPIGDFSVVKKNQDIVNQLMAFVFNPLMTEVEVGSAMAPFYPKPFYSTRLFDQKMRGEHHQFEVAADIEADKRLMAVIYQAYLIILQKFYDFHYDISLPFAYKVTDTSDNSMNYYKILIDPSFTEVKVHGTLKKLTKKDLKSLFDHTNDLDYWNEKIPLNQFEFYGFLHFTHVDITQEYVISQLKSDLLEKNTILSEDGFDRIKSKIKTLIGDPDLEFGLAAFSDFESSINQNVIWRSIVPQSEFSCNDYEGTFYEKAYRERRILLQDNLKDSESDAAVEALMRKGIRSHAVVPLFLEDEAVGMVEFGSRKAGNLNYVQVKRVHELFPVFAIALKRSKEELNDRIRAIIQEECTAIHPVVEWRFRQAATNMLEANFKGAHVRMEPILFKDVVPLYGASDIRNSSIERNEAIQSDLLDHLNMVRELLIESMADRDMPLLHHLVHLIDGHLENVRTSLRAGDEMNVLEFIRRDVEPLLNQLKGWDTAIAEKVNRYFSRIDPDLGVVYKKRKEFEDSLTQINDRVGAILDEEQNKAQQVFPHYFEKYRTDGVEYNAYIGQSMVQDQPYHTIYLKNLRLWQLLVKIRVAQECRKLIPQLKTKLEITQLILVHSNPLSIAFRQDEKKFDVAGAYNIRYEITKKRIDKAVIKGTTERITQVGKIAIIYSNQEEIEEYRSYIRFLVAKGALKPDVEELDLEDMKGASGLRALRIEVNFDHSDNMEGISLTEIKEAIAGS
jgi:hypothetical protein